LQLQLQTGLETGDQDEPTGTFTPFRNSEVQNGTAQRMTASKASDRCRQDELDAADKTNPL